MVTFLISIAILVGGYFVYGKLIERIFVIDTGRPTPAVSKADGVDFIILPNWKIFLIQFLNIAGLGPIFGAIAGAMFGPVAFLWIVLGSIFAGGVHDFFSGMLSLRNGGGSISEVVGTYLGKGVKQLMRVFTVVLLIFVGTVFLVGPAKIIDGMTNEWIGVNFWVLIILAYYIFSTLLPVDKLISKVYPLFGIAMIFMAVGLFGALLLGNYSIPELTPENWRNLKSSAETTPIFPVLFITIACGAISGFHCTQSPLMARCIKNESQGRSIFYGAMITEGLVALIWAAAAMVFFGNVEGLNSNMIDNGNNAAWAANSISMGMLGKIGGVLAVLGIVAAPITSGDTAFRSARLIIADAFKLEQGDLSNRLKVSIPLFVTGYLLTQMDFGIIWRYFAWSNQTLATIMLWTATAYMVEKGKNYWITLVPSVFMTAVVTTYIFIAPEGFGLDKNISYVYGAISTIVVVVVFTRLVRDKKNIRIISTELR